MSSRKELANAIRALSMDAVQKAKSGHPGAPMGMADIAEVLWRDFLKHNPQNPSWADRDRFVLSNGHGSMLIYSLLHLTGYDLPMEELKTSVSCTLKLRATRKWVTPLAWKPLQVRWVRVLPTQSVWRLQKKRWRRSLTVRATTSSTTTPTPSWATAA